MVAKEGHFGRAATRLNMTQPAVSQRIQALEREVGAELLVRSARDVQLTATGEFLLPYARRLVQIADEAVRDVKTRAATGAGKLRIAYVAHIDVAIPATIVTEFRRRHPHVELETSFAYSRLNIERVVDGELDLAFIATAGDFPDGIAYRPVGRGEMVAVLPVGHRLAGLDPIPAGDLRGEELILFPPRLNPGLAASLRSWFTRNTATQPKVVAYEPGDQAVELVLRSGSAITLTSRNYASNVGTPGILYRRLAPAPLFELGVVCRQDDPSPALARLLQVVDEVGLREDARADGELIT